MDSNDILSTKKHSVQKAYRIPIIYGLCYISSAAQAAIED